MHIHSILTASLVLLTAGVLLGNDRNAQIDESLAASREWPGVIRTDIGVALHGTKIPALITADDLDLTAPKTRITIVAAKEGSQASTTALHAMKWFSTSDEAAPYRKHFALSCVPIATPEADKSDFSGFPPTGGAYNSEDNRSAHYLWRWLGMHAPDLVIAIHPGEKPAIWAPESELPQLQKITADAKLPADTDLVSQLVTGKPCEVAAIPAVRIAAQGEQFLDKLRAIMDSGFSGPSPARLELQRRVARSPLEVCNELTEHYGKQLGSVVYIPAVALMARLRLGELTGDPQQLAAVERIAAQYVTGNAESLPGKPSSSHLSGHLIFSELARHTGNERYAHLAQQAADLGFDDAGQPKASMPYHSDMSDSVFMGCPILVQTGKLTGDTKYYDMALKHFRYMQRLCLRDDHLYRHSPLDEAAWGRGNGFPALGVALCLSDLPTDHAAHAEMLASFQKHMAALAAQQDPTGMWHQVIDHPGSYREFSCTCMITFAMLRGMQRGWLDQETYAPCVERSWAALLTRIGPEGRLVDVCTGTGKQRSLNDYLERTAILGRDDRGGAMALLVATEMEAYRRSLAKQKR